LVLSLFRYFRNKFSFSTIKKNGQKKMNVFQFFPFILVSSPPQVPFFMFNILNFITYSFFLSLAGGFHMVLKSALFVK